MNLLKTTCCQLILACLLLLSTSANAALIRIQTDQQQYQTGDTVTAWLRVENATETLTGFFLALQYQPAQLWLESWTFGTGFNDGFGSYAYSAHDLINGKLSLEEYADWAADLDLLMAQQQQGFVLAAFKFTVKKAGNFVLELDNSYLGFLGQSANMLSPDWAGVSIQVTDPTAVPAPPSALLMLCPLLWLSLRRTLSVKRTKAMLS
ncbi:hypothetical protein [Rheinheimera sp.]|uniref:hypothetical protein n=1 Tax=Rheinheimera sp. TaxID=1869214 RepID=UPI002FDCE931